MMNNAIGMQNSLESILSVFNSIIISKNFDMLGKLSFNHFCKIRIYLQQFRMMFHIKNLAIVGESSTKIKKYRGPLLGSKV